MAAAEMAAAGPTQTGLSVTEPIVEMTGISIEFPGVKALQNVGDRKSVCRERVSLLV